MEQVKKKMSSRDMRELMRLRGWTQARLARELDVTEGAVSMWLSGQRPIMGPASILMRLWLDQARTEEEAKKQPV